MDGKINNQCVPHPVPLQLQASLSPPRQENIATISSPFRSREEEEEEDWSLSYCVPGSGDKNVVHLVFLPTCKQQRQNREANSFVDR